MKRTHRFVADFDSTTSMVVALGGFLRGSDLAAGGAMAEFPRMLASAVNALPVKARRALYRWSGWWDAVPPASVAELDMEDISRWVTALYPERPYQGVVIGSSNGAATHLCAALGIPVLPQTFLVPVRRHLDPDALNQDMEWGRREAAGILERHPDIQIHQMHDPIQDRLMVERMGYFRTKKLRLGQEYERFLKATVEPGGTIFLMECTLDWPATKVQDRHYFQVGGYGALEPKEILDGSGRVEEFLKRQGSSMGKLDLPVPDGKLPEAEWGYAPALGDDIRRFAKQHGYRVKRITFRLPDDLSSLVADLYIWWYRSLGLPVDRLLGECFALLEPWWVLRTRSVPYWIGFNTEPSAAALEKYLDGGRTFEEIHLMLMSNGIESVGIAPVERWKRILDRASFEGSFLGMDETKFPLDLGSFGRYHANLVQRFKERVPIPAPLTVTDIDAFFHECGEEYSVAVSDPT